MTLQINYTQLLLYSIFDVAMHRYSHDDALVNSENTAFDNYGAQFLKAETIGEAWITSNTEPPLFNQYRVLVGWCYALMQQFLFNYAYLCNEFIHVLEKTRTPAFMKYDLLSKMGIDLVNPKFMKHLLQYSLNSESVKDFEMVLLDVTTTMPI